MISPDEYHRTLVHLANPAGQLHHYDVDIGAGRGRGTAKTAVPGVGFVARRHITGMKDLRSKAVEHGKIFDQAIDRTAEHIKVIVVSVAIRSKGARDTQWGEVAMIELPTQ